MRGLVYGCRDAALAAIQRATGRAGTAFMGRPEAGTGAESPS